MRVGAANAGLDGLLDMGPRGHLGLCLPGEEVGLAHQVEEVLQIQGEFLRIGSPTRGRLDQAGHAVDVEGA